MLPMFQLPVVVCQLPVASCQFTSWPKGKANNNSNNNKLQSSSMKFVSLTVR